MFTKNVGTWDRVGRVVLGLALLVGFFVNTEAAYRWLYLIGLVPLITGLVGSCGLYSVLGVSTCSLRK